MRWSFKIATVAGTEVRVHVTFFFLLVFVAVQGMEGGRGAEGAVASAGLVLSMFFCVLLHEFGHVFAARGYGIKTPDITLLPIGGIARLERMPSKPSEELVVALCGPLVNVVIAGLIALGMGVSHWGQVDYSFNFSGGFWHMLMTWNIFMVAFNMVPAFPMDGGRVLRAVLGFFMEYGRATRVAATLGQGIAMMVVLGMLLGGGFNPFLALIAFFVFWAAGQEAAVVTQREATRDLAVKDAMLTEFHRLGQDAQLREAVDFLLAGSQQDFPVLDASGGIMGLVTRHRLITVLAAEGPSCPIDEVMEPCPEALLELDALPGAMEKLQASGVSALPVLDVAGGRLVGLLTLENIGETLMVRAALRQARLHY